MHDLKRFSPLPNTSLGRNCSRDSLIINGLKAQFLLFCLKLPPEVDILIFVCDTNNNTRNYVYMCKSMDLEKMSKVL